MGDLKEGIGGRITVGTLLNASSFILPKAIKKTISKDPEITIRVVVGTDGVLVPALRAGEIDIMVGRLPSAHSHRVKLVREKLYQEDILLVTRTKHPLTWRKSIKFSDLTNFGWILPPMDTTLRHQLDWIFAKAGHVLPKPLVESVSYLTNLRLLQDTDMIGLMARQIAKDPINAGVLSELSWRPAFSTGLIEASYCRNPGLSMAAKSFLYAMKDIAAKMDSSAVALDSDSEPA